PKAKATGEGRVSSRNPGKSPRPRLRVLPRARSEDVVTTTGTSATAEGRSEYRRRERSRSSAPEASLEDSSSGSTPGSTIRISPIPKFRATRAAEPRLEAFWGRTSTRPRVLGSVRNGGQSKSLSRQEESPGLPADL